MKREQRCLSVFLVFYSPLQTDALVCTFECEQSFECVEQISSYNHVLHLRMDFKFLTIIKLCEEEFIVLITTLWFVRGIA